MTIQYDVPLFPLGTVLFPEGRLPLKIFEQRYMDMAKVCLKNNTPFGVCLIVNGRETGAPALPHDVGTLARIVDWDMPQLGVLHVQCRGEQRFRIVSRRIESSGLQRADIDVSDPPLAIPIPAQQAMLAELLERIIDHLDDATSLQPYRFDDAAWVGYRLGEMLPMNFSVKQKILELDDAALRLDVVRQFLQDKGLLNQSR